MPALGAILEAIRTQLHKYVAMAAGKAVLVTLWLAAAHARPLPEAYAQRYGSVTIGDRGGIIVRGTKLHAPLAAV